MSKNEELIAPCGMNCALCMGYQAQALNLKDQGVKITYCIGCRAKDKLCALKKGCTILKNKEVDFCYQCDQFPCERLKRLDKRYRTKYHMSMIDNLNRIKEVGLTSFISEQKDKWQCHSCDKLICCHNGLCFNCQFDELKLRKNKLGWK